MLKVTRLESSIVVIGLLLFTLLTLSSCDDTNSDPADTNTLGLPKTIFAFGRCCHRPELISSVGHKSNRKQKLSESGLTGLGD